MKIHHQQAANLNDSDHFIEFLSRENNIYHQIGIAYLQYEITVEKDVANAADRIFVDGDFNRLVIIAFAFCFRETSLSTTHGSDIERNKYCGQVSTIMRALTNKGRDISSRFVEFDDSQAQIQSTSYKHQLINNNDVAVIKVNWKTYTSWTYVWILPNIWKNYWRTRIHLTFKTADLQDIIYTTLGDDSKKNFW